MLKISNTYEHVLQNKIFINWGPALEETKFATIVTTDFLSQQTVLKLLGSIVLLFIFLINMCCFVELWAGKDYWG